MLLYTMRNDECTLSTINLRRVRRSCGLGRAWMNKRQPPGAAYYRPGRPFRETTVAQGGLLSRQLIR